MKNTGDNTSIVPQDATTGATGDPIGTISNTTNLSSATSNPLQTASDGVNKALSDIAGVINTYGQNTTYTQSYLKNHFDDNYLGDGRNKDLRTQTMAASLKGWNIASYTVKDVLNFDSVNSIIVVQPLWTYKDASANQHTNELAGIEVFKKGADGVWRVYGNQRLAKIDLFQKAPYGYSAVITDVNSSSALTKVILGRISVNAPAGIISSITVSGPGLNPNPLTLTKLARSTTDYFYLPDISVSLAKVPPIGSVYTFTLTKADSSTLTYKESLKVSLPSSAYTFSITAPSGHSLTEAALGNSLNVKWTLPTGFSVASAMLSGLGWSTPTNGFCKVEWATGSVVTANSSGTITLPSTAPSTSSTDACGTISYWESTNGSIGGTTSGTTQTPEPVAVTKAGIQVVLKGTNGEVSVVHYYFE